MRRHPNPACQLSRVIPKGTSGQDDRMLQDRDHLPASCYPVTPPPIAAFGIARLSLILGLMVCLAPFANAAQTVAEFSWSSLQQKNGLRSGTVVADGKFPNSGCLAIQANTAVSSPLLVIEAPELSKRIYAVSGEIRYEGVEGYGYLETWNQFAGGKYFSRTLAEAGPMAKIRGTSAWRRFVIPFSAGEDSGMPTAIELNLVLPSGGNVWIGPVSLREYDAGENPLSSSAGGWWSSGQGGMIGGIAGSILGCMGGLIGIMVSRGKARGLVMFLLWCGLAAGALSLLITLVALLNRQPWHVWYPSALIGAIALPVFGLHLRSVPKRYEQVEMLRMHAMDVKEA